MPCCIRCGLLARKCLGKCIDDIHIYIVVMGLHHGGLEQNTDPTLSAQTDPHFHKMQWLLQEQEVVLLPDSSGLLMPVLTAEKKLIGLLMVEHLGSQATTLHSLQAQTRLPALQQAAAGKPHLCHIWPSIGRHCW